MRDRTERSNTRAESMSEFASHRPRDCNRRSVAAAVGAAFSGGYAPLFTMEKCNMRIGVFGRSGEI